MKKLLLVLLVFCVEEKLSFAQEADSTSKENAWTIHAEISGFIYPDDFYLNPIVWVKKNHLHLEARYNYEDFQTGSAFAGYNLEFGNKLHLDLTPMLGACIGNTNALLPGAEGELMYWHVGLYFETEYAFDLNDSKNNFFSYWGELYYFPKDWVWFGIVTQRIHVKEEPLDLQRGLFLSFQKDWFVISGYYFNPFSSNQFGALTLGVTFDK